MQKDKFIEKLYNTLVYEQLTNSKWIEPEYKDNLHKFIAEIAEDILGKELSDLVFDVALGQCEKGFIHGKEYQLTDCEELQVFIKDMV